MSPPDVRAALERRQHGDGHGYTDEWPCGCIRTNRRGHNRLRPCREHEEEFTRALLDGDVEGEALIAALATSPAEQDDGEWVEIAEDEHGIWWLHTEGGRECIGDQPGRWLDGKVYVLARPAPEETAKTLTGDDPTKWHQTRWKDEFRSKDRPALYATVWPLVQEAARRDGWAVALHGSLLKDLDVMAMPWTENAVPVADLIVSIALAVRGDVKGEATARPGGRESVTIMLGPECFIDLCFPAPSDPEPTDG